MVAAFISLDGVAHAPGGSIEDTSGRLHLQWLRPWSVQPGPANDTWSVLAPVQADARMAAMVSEWAGVVELPSQCAVTDRPGCCAAG